MMDPNTQPLKDVINELLELYKLSEKIDEVTLMEQWQELMGKMIAQHTKKIYLNKRRLYIEVSSSVVRSELALAKSKIIEMLNKSFGRDIVHDIVLK
jgi:predicted nucleic acid-binding Zn ribbon protein